jgi:hypothetical protein
MKTAPLGRMIPLVVEFAAQELVMDGRGGSVASFEISKNNAHTG